MDTAVLKQKIIAKSKELGIDKIGFASAEPFTHLEESMRRSKELGHTTGFEHPVLEERIYPEKSSTLQKRLFPLRWHIRHFQRISRNV